MKTTVKIPKKLFDSMNEKTLLKDVKWSPTGKVMSDKSKQKLLLQPDAVLHSPKMSAEGYYNALEALEECLKIMYLCGLYPEIRTAFPCFPNLSIEQSCLISKVLDNLTKGAITYEQGKAVFGDYRDKGIDIYDLCIGEVQA